MADTVMADTGTQESEDKLRTSDHDTNLETPDEALLPALLRAAGRSQLFHRSYSNKHMPLPFIVTGVTSHNFCLYFIAGLFKYHFPCAGTTSTPVLP